MKCKHTKPLLNWYWFILDRDLLLQIESYFSSKYIRCPAELQPLATPTFLKEKYLYF